MIWAKKNFEKMFLQLEITAQSFRNQSWKSSQSMNKIQKFLRVVDGHEVADFFAFWLFWLRSIFGHFFKIAWIKKWPEPKKLLKWKISFFMPVNLAKKFLNFVHTLALFSWLISKTLTSYFQIMGPFFKIIFASNHYLWLVLWLV